MQMLSRLLRDHRHLLAQELTRGLWFLGIGGTVALFNLALVWLFAHQDRLPYIAYIALVTEGSILLSFTLNDRLTFQSLAQYRASRAVRCLRFHGAAAFGAVFTIALSTVIHYLTGWHPTLSQAAAIVGATAVNFLSHRLWTYRKPRPTAPRPDVQPLPADTDTVMARFD